ncbi:DinB family protein [Modestobacter excelsi]|uniref:DinB family protein n=1 Tax=Modestobacter excelsi TaxID=2213161 RepID=UPI00110CEB8F|nr:DinB family protein [Modestobacter excelsi]
MTTAAVPPLPAEDHVCPACGLDFADLPVDVAAAIVRAVPGRARALLAGRPDDALRRRPDPDTWSAAEYLCHLRDVYVTSTIRLHRARTEELPVLEPMLNDLRARRFRYADCDVPAVLGELAAAVDGVADEVRRVTREGWERRVTRLPGEERTVRWLLRNAAHEGRHHLADIDRGLRAGPPPAARG